MAERMIGLHHRLEARILSCAAMKLLEELLAKVPASPAARAWLDLRQRRAEGQDVDEKTVRKHLNDVLRLSRVLTEELRVALPPSVHANLMTFANEARKENVDLKSLGFPAGASLDNIVEQLTMAFPVRATA